MSRLELGASPCSRVTAQCQQLKEKLDGMGPGATPVSDRDRSIKTQYGCESCATQPPVGSRGLAQRGLQHTMGLPNTDTVSSARAVTPHGDRGRELCAADTQPRPKEGSHSGSAQMISCHPPPRHTTAGLTSPPPKAPSITPPIGTDAPRTMALPSGLGMHCERQEVPGCRQGSTTRT